MNEEERLKKIKEDLKKLGKNYKELNDKFQKREFPIEEFPGMSNLLDGVDELSKLITKHSKEIIEQIEQIE